MKILVTGAKGFVGKNFVTQLRNLGYNEIFEFDIDTEERLLDDYCKECEFIFHLAGVNRPKNESEFMDGNYGFTNSLLDCLKKHKNNCPIMISSSTQAALDNPYGKSKKAGEELIRAFGEATGSKVLIYRFPNIFGKWCKPNYNSAVATFCNNIANGLPITINNRNANVNLVYIDDVVYELIQAIKGNENRVGDFCEVNPTYNVKLGEIVDALYSFKESRNILSVPDMSCDFEKKLYSTYLSYIPKTSFNYPLKMNIDNRGSFTEFIKTSDRGQVSVNITKPGVTKGNHWHNSKNEKFLVVSGKGVIRFRNMDPGAERESEVIEYFVSGEKLEVLDIPTGYTHNIENVGDSDLVTIMWANEAFDQNNPDTYFMEV